jgi:hypothetical protein
MRRSQTLNCSSTSALLLISAACLNGHSKQEWPWSYFFLSAETDTLKSCHLLSDSASALDAARHTEPHRCQGGAEPAHRHDPRVSAPLVLTRFKSERMSGERAGALRNRGFLLRIALDLETSNQVYELWKHSYPPSPFRRPGRQLHEIGAVGKSIAGNTG